MDIDQAIDITSLATLGPAVREVYYLGSAELIARSSMIALAEQPELRND